MKEKEYIVKKHYDMGVYMCDLVVGELVRCKDCRYRKKVGTSYYCELDEFNVKDADFCSWGEREGGTE